MAETKKKNSNLPRILGVIIGFTILWLIKGWLVPSEQTLYYDNGEKKAEGKVKNDKEQGEWTYWYESGQVESVQLYENGELNGPAKWYFPDGKLKKEGGYENGLGQGDWTFYYPNGQVLSKGKYFHNKMTGKWVEYNEDGSKKSEGNYDNGMPEGDWMYYFPNGTPEAYGKMAKGKEMGLWVWNAENGNKVREVVFDSSGSRTVNAWRPDGTQSLVEGNGFLFQFYPDGKVQSQAAYANGVPLGPFVAYYEDGSLRERGSHGDGVYRIETFQSRTGEELVKNGTGRYVLTTDKGIKVREGKYENGLQTGEWRTFQLDGTPLIICEFANGKLNGNFVQFYESGAIQSRGKMQDDQKVGKWIYYDERGNKVNEEEF